MYGEYTCHIVAFCYGRDRRSDIAHAISEILTAVGGNAYDFATKKTGLKRREPVGQRWFLRDALRHPMQCVNHGIARHKNTVRWNRLRTQRLCCNSSWRKMLISNSANNFAVNFLGPRPVDVVAAQPSLDMAHWNLAIISGKRAHHGCRRVTLHDDAVWFGGIKH